MCTFAIQTVICGNITGNLSDPIRVNTGILHPSKSEFVTATASISALATALIISVAVFIIVVVVILIKSKAKTRAASNLQLTNRAERTEPMYEDVKGSLSSVGAVNTQDNAAYGYIQN